jgi:Tfp pilus assembly protein PilN
MPIKFNFLPPELAISKNLITVLKTVRAIGVISLAVSSILAIGAGAFFVISSSTLKQINSTNSRLEAQIKAQEKSEQQFVLLRDRIAKIATIRSQPDSSSNLELIKSLINSLPSGVSVNELHVNSGSIRLSLGFGTNSILSSFLSSLRNSTDFGSIVITDFSMDPVTGYTVGVTLSKPKK